MGWRQATAEVGAKAAEGDGPRPRARPPRPEQEGTGQISANHARCRVGDPSWQGQSKLSPTGTVLPPVQEDRGCPCRELSGPPCQCLASSRLFL